MTARRGAGSRNTARPPAPPPTETELRLLRALADRLPTDIREAPNWTEVVVGWGRLLGWLVYHTHRSTHSEAGFPDLCLVIDPRSRPLTYPPVLVELKRTEPRSALSDSQRCWLDAFSAADTIVAVWRPEHARAVLEFLIDPLHSPCPNSYNHRDVRDAEGPPS